MGEKTTYLTHSITGDLTDKSKTKKTPRKDNQRRTRNFELMLGVLIVLVFAVVALAAPLIAPPTHNEDPYLVPRDGFAVVPQPPNTDHPLGTMKGQYDIFYGLIWGTRVAFRIGLLITAGRALVGVLIGITAGYFGGPIDAILMRITDAFLSFPLMAVILVFLTVGSGIIQGNYLLGDEIEQTIALALILFGWMQYTRLMRGNVLVEREKTYIKAATATGTPPQRIIIRHLLPNATQGLFVMIASDVGAMVATMAAFSFLGFTGGFNIRPAADWGHMLSDSRDFIIGMPGHAFKYWYTYMPCSLAILFFSIGWNLIGDGLRDVLDPRLNGRRVTKTQS